VRHVIRCLLADLDITMATTGNARTADLTPELLTTCGAAPPDG
jgi:isopentenyl diphosphate isomerase/L-lactate dehydrogenase-like FMN-dependent dehydrogenase